MKEIELPLNKYGNRRGMNPNSRVNMSKPGETHNHRGGPQISLLDLLRQELKKIPQIGLNEKENLEHLTNAQLICERYMIEVKDGNIALLRDLIDRIEGKPAQVITGAGGGPLIRQDIKVISQSDILPALEALASCGVISVCQN